MAVEAAVREAAGLEVRVLRADDLGAVARVHMAAFPESAIGALGVEAVRRYYEWQCEPVHDAIGFGAVRAGELVGFCFGGVFRGAVGGFLRKNLPFLALAVAAKPTRFLGARFRGRALLGARLIGRLAWRKLRTRVLRRPEPPRPAREPRFSILAIATDPRAQGSGVGKALMRVAEAEARRRGFARMELTVHPSNTQAVRFYQGLGWERDPATSPWNGTMTRRLP